MQSTASAHHIKTGNVELESKANFSEYILLSNATVTYDDLHC